MIGIVTVLYNSAPVLEDFFRTLNDQTYKDFVLYVIDNKSKDNSLDEADKLSKAVDFKTVILPQDTNWGIAKGNNIGIEAALKDNCEYILLSNNDIVLEKTAIEELLNGLLSEKASLVVPKIYYWNMDRIIWMVGGDFRWLRVRTNHIGGGEKDQGQYNFNSIREYAPTCFMLIESNVFNRVGMMDEKYFVYFDDTDFVWRAVKKGNERLCYIFKSIIYHKVSFSTGGGASEFTQKLMFRNVVYFSLKHFNYLHCFCVFLYLFFKFILKDFWTQPLKNSLTELSCYKEGVNLYRNLYK